MTGASINYGVLFVVSHCPFPVLVHIVMPNIRFFYFVLQRFSPQRFIRLEDSMHYSLRLAECCAALFWLSYSGKDNNMESPVSTFIYSFFVHTVNKFSYQGNMESTLNVNLKLLQKFLKSHVFFYAFMV